MKTTIMKEVTFAAAHNLPHHEGACHNLHGHEWIVRVYVQRESGDVLINGPAQGMVMDFKDLKTILNTKVVEVLDHSHINADDGEFHNPTAENIGKWIWGQIFSELSRVGVNLIKVEVWETPTSCAIVEDIKGEQ